MGVSGKTLGVVLIRFDVLGASGMFLNVGQVFGSARLWSVLIVHSSSPFFRDTVRATCRKTPGGWRNMVETGPSRSMVRLMFVCGWRMLSSHHVGHVTGAVLDIGHVTETDCVA